MGCIGDMLLHCAILYVVVDVITSIICTTYTYKVLHKVFFCEIFGYKADLSVKNKS
jgi:hypothetical protein